MDFRSCTGVVLAGGASSRFGGALKGLLPLGRQRVIDRVLVALGEAADEVIVIANDRAVRRELPDIAVHADIHAGRGSLVGLYSGLSRVREAALVTAWDMPFVATALLRELRRIGEASGAAVLPEGPCGPEPLCAYYPRWCGEVMKRQLTRGVLRLAAMVDALPSRIIVPLVEVARFGAPERLFANINTAYDLEAAVRWLDAAQQDQPSHSGNRQ